MLKAPPFQSSSLGLQNCSLRNGNAESLPGREIIKETIDYWRETFHVSLSGDTIVLVIKFHPKRCCDGKVDRGPLTYILW